jgi:hypothetical protein
MRRWLTALPLLAAGACSVVPEPGFPPYADYQVDADYVFAQAGEHCVPVPHSDGSVTVLAMRTEPQASEVFAEGRRFLLVPPGCDHLTVHCNYRDYAHDGRGTIRRPEALFPGARVLRIAP